MSQPSRSVRGEIEGVLRTFAPPAEESYHLTGKEPFYAIKESDLPKLVEAIHKLMGKGRK